MNELTFEERNLVCIYSAGETRTGVISALAEMRGYLEPDEAELRELTDSAMRKLKNMTDAEYGALELLPDYDPEDADGQ